MISLDRHCWLSGHCCLLIQLHVRMFSRNVKTNLAKQFLKLIPKHFPKHHKFHKLFNKNNVKVSYSCMPNIKSKINQHNKKIIPNSETNQNIRTCNCINKQQCPLSQQCLSKDMIYQAIYIYIYSLKKIYQPLQAFEFIRENIYIYII